MAVTGARIKTDRELQLDVLAELNRDCRFKPAEIGVEVDEGVVTLLGTVTSYVKVGQAAEVATSVAGVKDVANKLKVDTGGIGDDTKLARAVRDALVIDAEVPDTRIDSVVRDGVITLTGTVDHWAQRRAAHDAVARVTGVRNVNNHIVVKPPFKADQELFEDIRAALRRRLPLHDIEVVVDRSEVTIQGKVPSYAVRFEAEEIAWGASGVKSVRNKIVVDF